MKIQLDDESELAVEENFKMDDTSASCLHNKNDCGNHMSMNGGSSCNSDHQWINGPITQIKRCSVVDDSFYLKNSNKSTQSTVIDNFKQYNRQSKIDNRERIVQQMKSRLPRLFKNTDEKSKLSSEIIQNNSQNNEQTEILSIDLANHMNNGTTDVVCENPTENHENTQQCNGPYQNQTRPISKDVQVHCDISEFNQSPIGTSPHSTVSHNDKKISLSQQASKLRNFTLNQPELPTINKSLNDQPCNLSIALDMGCFEELESVRHGDKSTIQLIPSIFKSQGSKSNVAQSKLNSNLQEFNLSKHEIETLIVERNELYDILRSNEDEASARYATEKRLISMKQEYHAEQQRFRQQIRALEEELEVTLSRLNQLMGERSKWSNELAESKSALDDLQHKCNSSEARYERSVKQLEQKNQQHEEKFTETLKQTRIQFEKEKQKIETELRLQIQMLNEEKDQLENDQKVLATSFKELQTSFEQLKNENSCLITQNKEKELLLIREYEQKLEAKISEKNMEQAKLLESHTKQIAELIEKMDTEKNNIILEIRSCYTDRIQELQQNVTIKQTEITNLANQLDLVQNQLTESRSQDCAEKLRLQMAESISRGISEWGKERMEMMREKLDELRLEKDAVIDSLKLELNEQRLMATSTQEMVDTLEKNFEQCRSEYELKCSEYEKQIESLQTQHAEEVAVMQTQSEEKIKEIQSKTELDTKQFIDEKLVTLKLEMDRQMKAERNNLLEDLTSSATLIATKLDSLVDDIDQCMRFILLEFHELIKLSDVEVMDENSDLDKFHHDKLLVINTPICSSRKWTINDLSFQGVLNSLTNYSTNSFMNIENCLTELVSEIRDQKNLYETTLNTRMTNLKATLKCVQEQASIEKSELLNRIQKYKVKLEESLKIPSYHNLCNQLKEKDDEISCLKEKIVQIKSDINESENVQLKNEWKEEKSQQPNLVTTNRIVLSPNLSSQGTRVITDLKNRIQRLREENMSLRRLLLRKQITPHRITVDRRIS